jgi:four helix bundle protein
MSSSIRLLEQWAVGSGQWAEAREFAADLPRGETMPVQNYRGLIAWQKSMELVKLIYSLTKKFPRKELFGLTSQIRRAVVSIPSNIAEGQGRRSTKEFIRHLSIGHGSLRETETQNLIAEMQGYISAEESIEVMNKCAEVGKLINGLANSLKEKESRDD